MQLDRPVFFLELCALRFESGPCSSSYDEESAGRGPMTGMHLYIYIYTHNIYIYIHIWYTHKT